MKTRLISFAIITIAVFVPMARRAEAQTTSINDQGKGASSSELSRFPTRQVVASASGDSIRFTALGELIQMRLEIIGASGETVYDSDFKPANLIDWSLTDQHGQRLADGSYLCIITVKDAAGQLTRNHGLAGLRDQGVSLRQSENSLLSAAQAAAAETNAGDGDSVTIVEAGQFPSTAVLTHDGTAAQLVSGRGGLIFNSGDFFANRSLEQMRLTADGNLGIGVANPRTKLDVAGLLRTSAGIVFPDGTIQYSAASKTLGARSSRSDQPSEGKQGIQTQATGVGTQGRLAKWTDTVGTLGDSVIAEVNGNLGVGTPSPQSFLHLKTGDILNKVSIDSGMNNGQFSELAFLDRGLHKWELVKTLDNQFGIYDSAGFYRVYVKNDGNVGIGTTSPSSKLTVAGVIESSGGVKFPDGTIQTTAATGGAGGGTITGVTAGAGLWGGGTSGNVAVGLASGGVTTTELANGAVTSAKLAATIALTAGLTVDQGNINDGMPSPGVRFGQSSGEGIASKRTSGGNLWGLDFYTNFSPRFSISNGGNVGIGTTTPGTLLEARRDGNISTNWQNAQLRISGSSDPAMQLNLGYDTTNNLGIIQPGHSYVAFKNLALNPFGGNVGIGTTNPAARLDVNGNIKYTNMSGGKYRQAHTAFGSCISGSTCAANSERDLDDLTINAPANGVVFITAFVNLVVPDGGGTMNVDFSLRDSTNSVLALTTEQGSSTWVEYMYQRTATLTWMLEVGPGPVTVKTHVRNNDGDPNTKVYDHNLSVIYLPKLY